MTKGAEAPFEYACFRWPVCFNPQALQPEPPSYAMPDQDTIIIKAPPGTKARWVRQSQARGQKLGDWVRETVDKPANTTAAAPCQRCGSVVLVADGPGLWQCAMCGLSS